MQKGALSAPCFHPRMYCSLAFHQSRTILYMSTAAMSNNDA